MLAKPRSASVAPFAKFFSFIPIQKLAAFTNSYDAHVLLSVIRPRFASAVNSEASAALPALEPTTVGFAAVAWLKNPNPVLSALIMSVPPMFIDAKKPALIATLTVD